MTLSKVKLTPEEIADQLRGGERLAPGIWVDRGGALHVSIPELLRHFRLRDTPESRAEIVGLVREHFATRAPGTDIVEQE